MAAHLVDAKPRVVELLDTLCGLIYPPPRRLFSDIVSKSSESSKSQSWHVRNVISDSESTNSNSSSTDSTSIRDGTVDGRLVAAPALFECPSLTPALFFDAEGLDLSRTGKLSIIQLHVHHRLHRGTYLIDVLALKGAGFTTTSTNEHITLKSLLEDSKIPKVFFDVRMDSDALYGQFGILLAGIIDLQLMELASRMIRGDWCDGHLKGLRTCLAKMQLKDDERERVKAMKDRGKELFAPKKGGRYDVFNDRPLSKAIIEYCVVDVAYMPKLFEQYNLKLENKVSLTEQTDKWACRINDASRDRVMLAQNPHFTGGSARGPWGSICQEEFGKAVAGSH